MPARHNQESPWLVAAFAGLAATLVGIGLARFAYTPLLPALIEAGWFSPGDAVYLGAANLAGYLAGAVGARRLAARLRPDHLLRLMMLAAAASFIACMTPLSFAWYFVWRFVAGASGGVLMVMAATTVLPHVPPAKRGLAGGIVFTGVGLGIAASGTLVPALIGVGLATTWGVLGVLSLSLAAAAWRAWPSTLPPARAARSEDATPTAVMTRPMLSLYVVYGLVAVGLVAHMVFLVDYVARGLNKGIVDGGSYWVVFGLGAALGPVLAGRTADRIGFRATLQLFLAIQTAGVTLALAPGANAALYASSFLVGAMVPGIVPLVSGRIQEMSGGDVLRQRTAWSHATVAFSIGQAAAAYAFSYVFETTGRYDVLFMAGATATAAATLLNLLTRRTKISEP